MNSRSPLRALSLLLLVSMGLPACSDKDDDGDGGTDTSTTTDGGTTSDGGAADCVGATEQLDAEGIPTGFAVCADGAIDRKASRSWDPTIDAARCVGDETSRSCDTDADCTAGSYGACLTGEVKGGFMPEAYCDCSYSCAIDADCDSGELCVGPGVVDGIRRWPQCVSAACEDGDDCGSGECGIASWSDGCSYKTDIKCRTSADECRVDDDCGDVCGVGYYSGGAFECQSVDCALGRPLATATGNRTAPTIRGHAWASDLAPELPASPSLRRRLADHWADAAAMEHASVASFSRFSLQLMALGAPPALLVETQQALADEITHARLAYGLSSAYGGAAVAPGRLSLAGVEFSEDAEAILVSLVEEACVGETLGAAEARSAADGCLDPVVAGVLDLIAEDESRHAALAWKCLKWMLETHPELSDVADAAFDRAITAAMVQGERSDLSEHGLPGAQERFTVVQAALRSVIGPCRAALLQHTARAAGLTAAGLTGAGLSH